MAQRESSRPPSRGVVTGGIFGDRLGPGRTGVVPVLRGAGVLPVALRGVRHRSAGEHHAGLDRRDDGRDRWCPGPGAGRPDGLPEGRLVANVVVPTPDYVRVASHYGFAPDFCHAADPQSKGIVENLCGYAQRDLAVPLLTEAALTGTTVDVRAANTFAVAWCAEVNALVHSEICAVPDERLVIERELLRPLPSLRLQIGAPSVIRKVDRLSCIRYASARYSVPTRLIGTTVAVVLDHGAVCIVEPATGDDGGRTRTRRPGHRLDHDAHYDGPRPTPDRGPRPKTRTEQRFCALGEDAQAFLVGAAAIGNTRLGSELEILLGLAAAHGEDALLAALRRAVAFKRFRAADVRSILAAGAGTPHPRPAGDALILDLPRVPTRSLDDYAITPADEGGVTS